MPDPIPNAAKHMATPWHAITQDETGPSVAASLSARASLVGRVGLLMLSCGTGAWRVREAMNTIAKRLQITCSADIGLTSLSYTCYHEGHHYSQTMSIPSTGVNTAKLMALETFVDDFAKTGHHVSVQQALSELDTIANRPVTYSPVQAGLAAALACAAFVFLLVGGPIEMFCTFFGAGIGQWTRRQLAYQRLTITAVTALSVAAACVTYLLIFKSLETFIGIGQVHEAGYIGAMLFVIPGFPFITSGLDIAKIDMRSGLERLTYALMIILVATLTGWLVALIVRLSPSDFAALSLPAVPLFLLRLLASFCGVFGFSIMFNSPLNMAATAGVLGAVANTLRLTLSDGLTPPAAAAFLGALMAGLLASLVNRRTRFPRIGLTVPAIVIMVPGLYLYRGIYNLGINQISSGSDWIIRALLIVVALPLGLATARILIDKDWRHSD